ncbi:MAG: hypothetical protein HWN67_19205 [Candidatus Helarchaeota archaeon]|nr:hypothetical protein [Candidatus Helarchaeota archaeon]
MLKGKRELHPKRRGGKKDIKEEVTPKKDKKEGIKNIKTAEKREAKREKIFYEKIKSKTGENES